MLYNLISIVEVLELRQRLFQEAQEHIIQGEEVASNNIGFYTLNLQGSHDVACVLQHVALLLQPLKHQQQHGRYNARTLTLSSPSQLVVDYHIPYCI